MVRVAKALGMMILFVAVLILSLISYVSLRKDSLFTSSKYYMSGPRIMFHAGFRWVHFITGLALSCAPRVITSNGPDPAELSKVLEKSCTCRARSGHGSLYKDTVQGSTQVCFTLKELMQV